jgi:hypothetical protein
VHPPQGQMPSGGATPTYVVECYWPEITEGVAKAALAGIANAQRNASATNRIRPLGCILVPSDGMALFLFSSSSAAAVREAGELSQLPFDRIVESLTIMPTGTFSDG